MKNWEDRGKQEGSGEFFDFFQTLTRARAKGEVALVKCIYDAADNDWRAAAWLLERRNPWHWGKWPELLKIGRKDEFFLDEKEKNPAIPDTELLQRFAESDEAAEALFTLSKLEMEWQIQHPQESA